LDLGNCMRRDRPAGPGEPVAAVPGARTMNVREFPVWRGWVAACILAGTFAAHAANAGATTDAALRAAVAIEQARPPAQTLPREAFLDSRALQVARLAPDGRNVAWLRDEGESRSLWLLPTAGGTARRLLPRTDADRLYWSQDGRWLFLVSSRSIASLPL